VSLASIALVLLTEAHVTVAVSLSHAAVVHHEEVDLQLLGAGPPDVVVLRPYEVNHLHTATLARSGRRHRALWVGPVPGVVASLVLPGITLKTVNTAPGHTVSPSSSGSVGEEGEEEA